MVELVERAELAIDEVSEVMGQATIEAVLDMSAEALTGPKQAGKARSEGEAAWYRHQAGQVYLAERKVRVDGRGCGRKAKARVASSRCRLTWRCDGRGAWGPDAGDPAGRREHEALRPGDR